MEMGVGLVFLSGFEPALDLCAGLLDVLEVEPQTFWFNGAASTDPPQVDQRHLRYLASLPFPKLVHGVGFPIGSTRPPDPRQLPALKETLRALQPPWFSEHLSFNRARHNGVEIQTDDGTVEVVPAATVVVCAGQESHDPLRRELEERGIRHEVVGGARDASRVDAVRATTEGLAAARRIAP